MYIHRYIIVYSIRMYMVHRRNESKEQTISPLFRITHNSYTVQSSYALKLIGNFVSRFSYNSLTQRTTVGMVFGYETITKHTYLA